MAAAPPYPSDPAETPEVRHGIGPYALLPAALIEDPDLSVNAKVVLLVIARYANGDRQAFPSVQTITRATRLADRTVRRAVLEAIDSGWLQRERRGARSNLYTILWERGRVASPGRTTGLPGPVTSGLPRPEKQYQGNKTRKQVPEPDGSGVIRPVPAADVQAVFNAWVEATGKDPRRVVLTAKRRNRILDRLREGYALADLLAAVQGWQASPFHRGENRDGTVYNDLDLLLRDGAHVERFRDLWNGDAPQGRGPVSERERRQEDLLTGRTPEALAAVYGPGHRGILEAGS